MAAKHTGAGIFKNESLIKSKIMDNEKCLYDQWMDNEVLNLNTFTVALFKLFQYADGRNKQKILDAWGEYFNGSEYI